MSQTVVVHAPDGDLPVIRTVPATPNGAGVVVVQEIFGVSDYIVSRCQDLADEGYVVYAPVLYARLPEEPVLDEDAADYVQQGMKASLGIDWDVATRDVVAALAALRNEVGGGRVGMLGFCFGGGMAFKAAAQSDPDALVAYYGSALPGLLNLAPSVHAPQLHHWGSADAFIDAVAQQTVRDALEATGAAVSWKTYEGAGHAFDNPHGAFHSAEASAAAWPRTVEFLRTHLVDQPTNG